MSDFDSKHARMSAAVLGVWLVTTASSWAQSGAPTVPASSIRGFVVMGSNPLPEAEVTLALAPLLRQPASLENLQKATTTLEALLRDRGFGLHRVALPPQEVGEVIQLQVVSFAIGQVTIDGAKTFSEGNIRNSLPAIVQGGTPSLENLAIQTAMANENPSKNVRVSLRAADEPDLIDVAINVQDSPPVRLAASVNNSGTSQTGKDRFTLSVGHDNVLGLDHQFQASLTTSLANPSRVRQLGLNYRVPLYDARTFVDAQLTDSSVVGDFGTFTSTGAGGSLGLTATRYLLAQPGFKRFAFVSVEDKTFDPSALNGVALVGQQTRRSRPLTLGYAIKAQQTDQTWGATLSLATNLPGGRGNSLAAYQSEAPLVTKNRWSVLRANANWSKAFGEGWVAAARGQAQWSPTALIAGEQLGAGGQTGLRGTEERAVAGDSGLAGNIEITSPEWLPGLKTLAFWDTAWVNRAQISGSVFPQNDSVYTAGVGMRYARGWLSIALDYGRVFKGSNVPLNLSASAPKKGDQKLHLLLSARY